MSCNDCNNPCNRCEPAKYSEGFPACPNPFGDDGRETDTNLSTDYSGATLNYAAERHTDTITGKQLGSIINLGDLRDVDTESETEAMCSELIFHRYGDCGNGCRTLEDRWSRFSIDDEGAKSDSIRYVRGANIYGCPQYLDVPSNTNQFWFSGWRLNGEHKEFGYYQATPGELPKDTNGNYYVMSQDPTTKQPIIGTLPLDCILSNIMGSVGMNVYGEFSKVQEYKYITGSFNSVTGEFSVFWEDWYYNRTQHVGDGTVKGQVIWTSKFNSTNGNMVYNVTGIHYDNVSYNSIQGAPTSAEPIYLTLKGISMPDGAETMLVNRYQFTGRESWNIPINVTVPCNSTFSVSPGQTIGPMPYLYIFVDWEQSFDDQGYMNLYCNNKLPGWKTC